MKKVCMLLNGGIYHDSRVIKIIRTLSEKARLDLFYINGDAKDNTLFNDNVKLISFKHSKNKISTKLSKHSCFYNEFLFFKKAVLSQNVKYDIIYCNDLPCLKPGYLIKKEIGSQLIYDSHEIYTGTINQFFPDNVNILKKILFNSIISLMRFLGNTAEKKLVKHVDIFITTSHSFKTYFEEKFNRNDVQIVMNCPPIDKIKDAFDFRAHYNLSKQDSIVIFQGVFNKGRALLILIEAFKYTKKNVHLIFVGSGSLLPEMEKAVKAYDLTNNIHFFGRVSSTELLHYTKGADVGINLQAPINISKKLASANKLFEYIHAGIPVIATDTPENRKILDEFDVGVLVENKPNDIADAIDFFCDLKNIEKKTKNHQKAKVKYCWENQVQPLEEIIKKGL